MSSSSPSPPVGPPKEEVFRKVLQQQERLRAFEAEIDALERESHSWERSHPSPCPSPVSSAHLEEDMDALEQLMRKNQAELAHEKYWEEELQVETEKERGMRRKLGELHAKLDDCGRRLHEFSVRSAQLEQEIQREGQAEGKAPSSQESLDDMRAELKNQEACGTDLEEQLSETDTALRKAESLLQVRREVTVLEKGLWNYITSAAIIWGGVAQTLF